MTVRDRLMLIGILALAILVGGYLMVVSPERKQAAKITAEVQTARQKLQSAEAQAAEAGKARARYASEYASLVSLGQAVPSTTETPALIYALDAATHSRNVQFSSIATGASGAAGSSPSAASAASAASGFTAQPFTFIFDGSFVDLYKLLAQLEGFTAQTTSGSLHVSGRLLTIDGVQLVPGSSGSQSGGSQGTLVGTITATAYVLAPSQPALGGSASGPAGTSTTSPSANGQSPTSAAVVRANP